MVYSLADSAGGSFSIDKSTGIVVLERILDREVQPSYQITVRASDQGSPLLLSSLVNVTITVLDINDNPPVFERRDQLVSIPEDAGVGTKVLTVYAASKDIGTNAEITYSIRSGNEHGKFHIHPLTGESAEHMSGLVTAYRQSSVQFSSVQYVETSSVTCCVSVASMSLLLQSRCVSCVSLTVALSSLIPTKLVIHSNQLINSLWEMKCVSPPFHTM